MERKAHVNEIGNKKEELNVVHEVEVLRYDSNSQYVSYFCEI